MVAGIVRLVVRPATSSIPTGGVGTPIGLVHSDVSCWACGRSHPQQTMEISNAKNISLRIVYNLDRVGARHPCIPTPWSRVFDVIDRTVGCQHTAELCSA